MNLRKLMMMMFVFANCTAAPLMAESDEMPLPPGMEKMDLSDEKEEQIHGLYMTHRAKMDKLFVDLRIAQLEVRRLEMEENPSDRDMENALERVNSLRGEIDKERMEFHKELRNQLTPAQYRMWRMDRRKYCPNCPNRPQRGMRRGWDDEDEDDDDDDYRYRGKRPRWGRW